MCVVTHWHMSVLSGHSELRPDWGTSENVVGGKEKALHCKGSNKFQERRFHGKSWSPWQSMGIFQREELPTTQVQGSLYKPNPQFKRHKVVSDVNYATKNKLLKFLKMALIISTCQCYCKVFLNIHLEIKPS